MGAVENPYTKLEAKGLTDLLLQIRKMGLRPRADCLHTLTLTTVQLCFLEKTLLLSGFQESESSCLLNWGHTNTSPKAYKPLLSKDLESRGWCQFRISSR